MKASILFLAFALSMCTQSVLAQLEFHRSNEIPVSISGETLAHAWAGGINSSQWSTIDLNLDGHEDLFIYERSSDQIHTFLKNPVSGDFELSFEFAELFPDVSKWVLLRDYNCDGKKDIFTSVPGGIKVYENTSDAGTLSFDLKTPFLQTLYDFGVDPYYSNVYVSTVDIPSIADFDNDGDLDIHTFTLSGLTIEYHENMASQIGDCDSLAFEMVNRCYGMVAEDAVSPSLYIGQDYLDGDFCGYNVPDPHELQGGPRSGGLHSGSSLCVLDYDNNGQQDLLIGDITARDMALVLLEDRGAQPDSAIFLEIGFPASDVPVEMHVFLTAYYEDLDGDGVKDIMITPSNGTESEDQASCYFYKNMGTDQNIDLALQSSSYLQNQMIDMGTIAMPRPLDYNQDGLMDLVISNRGKYQDGGLYEEEVWLFENIGSSWDPSFELVTDNFAGLNSLGLGDHLCTSFGDLDGDADQDMVLGDGNGAVLVFENTAGPGEPVSFDSNYTTLMMNGEEMDLGANIVPQLFDYDNDGLLDLIAGERNGNINLLLNTGSSTAYQFELTEDSIGDFSADIDGNLIGYSAAWFFRSDDGQTHALIGGESGNLFYVENLDTDPSSAWTITDAAAYGVYNGQRSCPMMADYNTDGKPELLNGDHSGGLGLYMGGATPNSLIEFSAQTATPLSLYPNPNTGQLYIDLSQSAGDGILQLSDYTGRVVLNQSLKGSDVRQVNIASLASGHYTATWIGAQGHMVATLVKF